MMLKEKTSFYRVCFDSMQMGIIVFDSNLQIVMTNQPLLDMLGFREDELNERSVFSLFKNSNLIQSCIEKPNYSPFEMEIVTVSANYLEVEVLFGKLQYEGSDYYKLFVSNNVERKKKTARLDKLNKKLKKEVANRNKELDRLIAQFRRAVIQEEEVGKMRLELIEKGVQELKQPIHTLLGIATSLSSNDALRANKQWKKHCTNINLLADFFASLVSQLEQLRVDSEVDLLDTPVNAASGHGNEFSKSREDDRFDLSDFTQYLKHLKTYKYKKGSSIYCHGNRSNHIFLIKQGLVKTYKSDESGKELITGFYTEGDYFGYIALLRRNAHDENALALSKTELHKIDIGEIKSIIKSNKNILFDFIDRLTKNLVEARERLMLMAYGTVRKRTAEALLFLVQKHPRSLGNQIFMQRPDMAHFIGVAKETLIRTLQDFKKEQLIQIHPKYLEVVDIEGLGKII